MPIIVTCTSCGKRIQAPDKMLGQKAKCPKCQATIIMQTQEDIPADATRTTADLPTETAGDADDDPMAAMAAALGRQNRANVAGAADLNSAAQSADAARPASAAAISSAKPAPATKAAVKPMPVTAEKAPPPAAVKPTRIAEASATVDRPSQSTPPVSPSQMTPASSEQAQDDDIALAPVGMQTPSGLPVRRTTAADTEVQRGMANVARLVGIIMGALAFALGVAALVLLALEGRLTLAIGSFFFMLILAVALAIGGTLLRGSLRMMADMADTQRRQQAALDELLSRMD